MTHPCKKLPIQTILFAIQQYCLFFLLMSFVITCCMLLFLHNLSAAAGLELTKPMIAQAAKLTFGNVMLLSLLCTIVNSILKKYTVERPVRRIINAAEKMMEGDFSVRIKPIHSEGYMDSFDIIIDYFNRMAQELAGIETLRSDFIANVSHELKTPLAVMQNYGTMLQQPDLPEETRMEYAKAITDTSRRLTDLISNILKLNKLENQQIFPAAKRYDLGEQLCECLLGFEKLWEEKSLEIETDLADDVFVHSDPEMMRLVWNNLFSNAIKFTEPGGKITLTLRTESHAAVVQIADTGCGISPDVGKHIFDKFYQGDASHAAQGNGLGLALVKRVIDITGGSIAVESAVGKGTVFTVTIRLSSGPGLYQSDG